MPRLFGFAVAFPGFGRAPVAGKRPDRCVALGGDRLEARTLLSSIVHDPAYDKVAGYYQPLNGDTRYTITGSIGTHYAEHEYGFAASYGNTIAVTADLSALAQSYASGRIL